MTELLILNSDDKIENISNKSSEHGVCPMHLRIAYSEVRITETSEQLSRVEQSG